LLYSSEEVPRDFVKIAFSQNKDVFSSQRISDQYISPVLFSSGAQEAKTRKKTV